MTTTQQGNCWHCGQALSGTDYLREARCPKCAKATHACRNCRFFAPHKSNQCAEPVAETVADRERSNFCDYFSPSQKSGENEVDAEKLRQAAEDLFDF